MLAVLRLSAVKPAMDPKVLGTRISLTSFPPLTRENSSWFLVSRAKMVTRSASTRSSILSLRSTRMSWMLPAELMAFAISMSRLRYESSFRVPSAATVRVAMKHASRARKGRSRTRIRPVRGEFKHARWHPGLSPVAVGEDRLADGLGGRRVLAQPERVQGLVDDGRARVARVRPPFAAEALGADVDDARSGLGEGQRCLLAPPRTRTVLKDDDAQVLRRVHAQRGQPVGQGTARAVDEVRRGEDRPAAIVLEPLCRIGE